MQPRLIKLSHIPHKPGVYLFLNRVGGILYVGKAIDLRVRVGSYFSGRHGTRTQALVEKIANVETVVVESELEALILEANLIKKYLPPFNVRLIDDKDYLYIKITKADFPQVQTARKKDLERSKEFFGPYPSSKTVRATLKRLRRIFPWCSQPPRVDHQTDSLVFKGGVARPCFYYHLGLCSGACVGLISQANYNKIIKHLIEFLRGNWVNLKEGLVADMEGASELLEYERAQAIKGVLEGMEYLTQPNRVQNYLENPNFLTEENHLGMEQLCLKLNLESAPERIEGYDISNIGGKEAVGSMVVLTHGEVDKSQYRKFKIKSSGRPNDVGMHKEMIERRLNHPEWGRPDLIIVDGGRGQAKAVAGVVSQRGLRIPVFGLAKRMEWLYPPEGNIIKLLRRSPALRIVQRLRDESHRFALAYHRKLRSRVLLDKGVSS